MNYAFLAGGGVGALMVAFAILTDRRARHLRYGLALLGVTVMIACWLILP